jgi:6-carboxyhexanoate--CoA ligase
MRASQQKDGGEEHISGAERITTQEHIESIATALLRRALCHSKGEADFINLQVQKLHTEPLLIDALPVTSVSAASVPDGREQVCTLLAKIGVARSREIMTILEQAKPMRGAMLLDAVTLAHLEPDRARGVRVSNMDYADSQDVGAGKQHFTEALALASKVAHCPDILAEVCISDDPDYVTGYVASRELGYVRITPLKELGVAAGGRVFLYKGAVEAVPACIEYLQQQPVLLRNCR